MRTVLALAIFAALSQHSHAATIHSVEPPDPENYLKVTFVISPEPTTLEAGYTPSGMIDLPDDVVWLRNSDQVAFWGRAIVEVDGLGLMFWPFAQTGYGFYYRTELLAGLTEATFTMDNSVVATAPPGAVPQAGPWRDAVISGAGGYSRDVKVLLQPEPSGVILAGLAAVMGVGVGRRKR